MATRDAEEIVSSRGSSVNGDSPSGKRRDTCDPTMTARLDADIVAHVPALASSESESESEREDESPRSSPRASDKDEPRDAVAEDEPPGSGGIAVVSTVPLGEANATPPREVMLTARPGEVSKRQTERRMRLASQWGVLNPADIDTTSHPAEAEEAGAEPAPGPADVSTPPHSAPIYGHPSHTNRKINWQAASPTASETKKRKVRHVTILSVATARPIPDGVNTPRSLALCDELGIDPRQLAAKPESTFHSAVTSAELAQMRYESYEKRRLAHLERLVPLYTQRYGGAAAEAHCGMPDTSSQVKVRAGHGQAPRASPARAAASASEKKTRVVKKNNPHATRDPLESTTEELNAEDAAMEKQFAQQEAAFVKNSSARSRTRGVSASPQPENRGYLSARTAATSVGRSTVSPSPAAMRIQSRSIAEHRHLTAAEAEILAEIEYKEHMRQERLRRAHERQEMVQMVRLEESIDRERHTATLVSKRAAAKEAKQYYLYNTTVRRQIEARQRREALEASRKEKLERSLAEKAARSVYHDPYASLVAHRKFSTPTVSRAGSPRGPGTQ